jgi:hypothetical protein
MCSEVVLVGGAGTYWSSKDSLDLFGHPAYAGRRSVTADGQDGSHWYAVLSVANM